MSHKVNVLPIVQAHLATLRNRATGRKSFLDLGVFLGAPTGLAILAVVRDFHLHAIALNALVSSFSLFATILLNLIVLLFNFIQSSERTNADPYLSQRRLLLREINANICYTVVMSVAIVATSLVVLGYMKHEDDTAGAVPTFFLVAGFTSFILNILMIVKRMYRLTENELDRSRPRKSA